MILIRKYYRYYSRNKYRNNKITVEGQVYDSQKEYLRYLDLLAMEKAGEIRDIRRQVEYELLPVQREPDTVGPKGGTKKGKVIERKVSYFADFVYTDVKTGETVVEDTKSEFTKTKDYILKRKMMLFFHGIRIKEV